MQLAYLNEEDKKLGELEHGIAPSQISVVCKAPDVQAKQLELR